MLSCGEPQPSEPGSYLWEGGQVNTRQISIPPSNHAALRRVSSDCDGPLRPIPNLVVNREVPSDGTTLATDGAIGILPAISLQPSVHWPSGTMSRRATARSAGCVPTKARTGNSALQLLYMPSLRPTSPSSVLPSSIQPAVSFPGLPGYRGCLTHYARHREARLLIPHRPPPSPLLPIFSLFMPPRHRKI